MSTEIAEAITASQLGVLALEQEIAKLPQIKVETAHDFCQGVYARTVVLRAGTILTGAIHTAESFFLVREGSIVVTTDNGVVQLDAGHLLRTSIGTKRAGFALTDVVITEFLANPQELRDPDELWDFYTVEPSPSMIAEIKELLEAKS